MKRTVIMTLGILLCAGIIAGCKQATAGIFKDAPTTIVEILYDVTDPMAERPNSSEIVSLYNFNNASLYSGYELRIQQLSMVNLTPVFDLGIPAQNKLTGDELTRVAMIRGFRKSVQDAITSLDKEKVADKPFSVLYRSISQQLDHLSETGNKTDTKICVIYSDLIENSDDANFYSAPGYTELKKDPQAIIDHLEQVVPLDNLSGIRIYVVFKPKSYADEVRFDYAYAMYKQMWLAKGAASVSVGANLVTQ